MDTLESNPESNHEKEIDNEDNEIDFEDEDK
jgi:hypothetical protein